MARGAAAAVIDDSEMDDGEQDGTMNAIDPGINEIPEEGGKVVKPKNTEETKAVLRNLYKTMQDAKQKRKEANEVIAAEREKAVTMGVSKKAQAVVEAFMRLPEDDQQFFWESVAIYQEALGKPIQFSLELVDKED